MGLRPPYGSGLLTFRTLRSARSIDSRATVPVSSTAVTVNSCRPPTANALLRSTLQSASTNPAGATVTEQTSEPIARAAGGEAARRSVNEAGLSERLKTRTRSGISLGVSAATSQCPSDFICSLASSASSRKTIGEGDGRGLDFCCPMVQRRMAAVSVASRSASCPRSSHR